MSWSIVRSFLVVAMAASVACGRGGRKASEETVQSLQERLESKTLPEYVSSDDHGLHVWKAERRFYQRHAINRSG